MKLFITKLKQKNHWESNNSTVLFFFKKKGGDIYWLKKEIAELKSVDKILKDALVFFVQDRKNWKRMVYSLISTAILKGDAAIENFISKNNA